MKKFMFALLVIAMFLATTLSATANYNSVDAAVAASLAVGETRTLQVGAMQYEVTLIGAYEDYQAKFKVNGETTDLIEVGKWDFLADNSEIGVIEVDGDKVQFWIDPVPRIPSLSYTGANAPIMKVGSVRTFGVMGRQYEVVIKSLDRGGAKVSVNGEILLMRNPKEKGAYGSTVYRLDEQAMISMGMIFYYEGELYCSIHVGEITEEAFYLGEVEEIAIPEPIEPEQPAQELTYDRCVSTYFEKAGSHEIRQNYPEQNRIRQEGLRVCGERFGRPVPAQPMRSDYDVCIEKHIISEDVFISMSPEEQVEFKQKMSRECDRFVEVVEVHLDYNRCMDEVIEFKRMLMEKYDYFNLEIPDELMRQYEEKWDQCRVLSGEWSDPDVRSEIFPNFDYDPTRESPPARDYPEEAVPYGLEKPLPREFRRECSGCDWKDSCLPIGTRVIKENGEQKPLFCEIDKRLQPQKALREQCQNNYECVSNSCHDGTCQSIGEKIEGIEQELREQRGIMEKILGFFSRIFGRR